MASLSYYILYVTILCVTVINPTSCHDECLYNGKNERLFVFGDSLFDPGNIQYLINGMFLPANSWPYGMTYFDKPTGRVSDGRVVPDFIALNASLNYPPPFLKPGAVFTDGANFASAGSGALEFHSGTMNLRIQVSNFKKLATSMEQILGHKEARKILKKSVYLISMGGNDYFSYNTNNKNATISQQIEYVGYVMSNITFALEEIYSTGGRKIAFQNVGPLGCLPTIKQSNPETNGECAERYLTHARLHNNVLSIVLEELKNDLPGFKYAIFDYYKALLDRIENPTKYGFKYGDIGCCGAGEFNGRNCGGGSSGIPYVLCPNPSDYVFFDGGHTSEETNKQLAELIWNGPPNVTGPHYNVKKLFEL